MGIKLIASSPKTKKKNAPPILFVHGAWHGAWCWQEHFLPFFSKNGFQCYAFDLENHGNSKDLPDINQLRLADYLNNIQETISKIGEPCILIGHSMGGFIIQRYLEKNDCEAAVLIASVPNNGVIRLCIKMALLMPLSMVKMWVNFDLFSFVNTNAKVRELFFSKDFPESTLEKYTKKLGSESMRVFLFDLLFIKIKNRKNPTTPILVQSAGRDIVVSIQENKNTATFQNADYQFFNNLAHDVMLEENWRHSAQGILDWLNEKFPTPIEKETIFVQKISL